MSGGLAVKTKKRGVVRAGAQRLHGPRFLLVLVLTARGPQAPYQKEKGAYGGSEMKTFAGSETG
jgi:hypothetical protein